MLPSELLENVGWTQRAFARDADGNGTWNEPSSYCMIGAISASDLAQEDRQDMIRVLYDLIRGRYDDGAMTWQDRLPYTEASRQMVISTMKEVEIEVGVREQDEEWTSLATYWNADGVNAPTQETQQETVSTLIA